MQTEDRKTFLGNKFAKLVKAGLSQQLSADAVIKEAKTPEEFLYGLKLLVDAHMEEPPHTLPKLYQVQRAYHRNIRKVFGVKSITEAITQHIESSPVSMAKFPGQGATVLEYNIEYGVEENPFQKQRAKKDSTTDQKFDDPEMAEIAQDIQSESESDENSDDFYRDLFK